MAPEKKILSICAIIAARNELHYLKILLPLLAKQKIDVIIVDNESTDGSREFYSTFMGKPIIAVESLPYRGFFSMSEQLSVKQELIKKIAHDWVIHHDADEILEHNQPGRTLRDAIQEADRARYNILNFDEFVFLPEPGFDYFNRDYYTELLRYYFFEPKKTASTGRGNALLNYLIQPLVDTTLMESMRQLHPQITSCATILYSTNTMLKKNISIAPSLI